MHQPKIFRGVMCYDNEEWCKIWRGINLPVQKNWNQKFDKFSSELSKISIFLLKWAVFDQSIKIMFELKKVQRSYVWWHWLLMQNLKENWLALSKMTWRIWKIFVQRLKNNNFILESKKTELNQNKNSKQPD